MSLAYTLPEGFRWITLSRDHLLFEHVASEKRGEVSHCERAVTPDAELQKVINFNCTKLAREARLDSLWAECGGDRDAFERARATV